MNELQRLAYLDAMGIDSYVSRTGLPGAAPTLRARLLRREAQVQPANLVESMQLVDGLRKEKAPQRTPAPVPVQKSAPAPVDSGPVFSVLSCRVGNWLWLDEIPRGREQSREYLQLLQSICAALGLPTEQPHLERFDWPIADTRQMGNSEAAARDGFSGFLRGRLERNPVQGVVLLGVVDASWLDRSSLGDLKVVETVCAWQMLREPQLKRQAWNDLKSLRQL